MVPRLEAQTSTPPSADSPAGLVSTFPELLGRRGQVDMGGRGEGTAHGGQGAQVTPWARKEKLLARAAVLTPSPGRRASRQPGSAPEGGSGRH